MDTKNALRLQFTTVGGSAKTITIMDPRANLTGAEVKSVMDLIVSKNIFSTKTGDLAVAKSADVVQTNTTELTLS